VNFTGYACTNCHWMEANMFTRPEIAAALNGFVLVDLYTDGTDAASDANGKLELAKFQTAAEPFYAIMDPDEKVIATSAGVTRDPQEFLEILKKGAGGRGPGAGGGERDLGSFGAGCGGRGPRAGQTGFGFVWSTAAVGLVCSGWRSDWVRLVFRPRQLDSRATTARRSGKRGLRNSARDCPPDLRVSTETRPSPQFDWGK
jgi:hypothetical protein